MVEILLLSADRRSSCVAPPVTAWWRGSGLGVVWRFRALDGPRRSFQRVARVPQAASCSVVGGWGVERLRRCFFTYSRGAEVDMVATHTNSRSPVALVSSPVPSEQRVLVVWAMAVQNTTPRHCMEIRFHMS